MRVEEGYLEPPGELTTGKKFNMTWVICNTGPEVWSQGIRLVYYSGYNFEGILEGPVGSLEPGERKIITVCVTAPSEPGIYGTHLRLCTEDGLFFGDILPIVVKIVPSFGMDYLTEQLSAMTTNPTHMTTPTNEQLLYDVHSDGLEDRLTIQTLSPPNQYNSTTEMIIENPQVDMTPVGPLPLEHCTSLPDAPLIVDHCSPPIDHQTTLPIAHCATNYVNDNNLSLIHI